MVNQSDSNLKPEPPENFPTLSDPKKSQGPESTITEVAFGAIFKSPPSPPLAPERVKSEPESSGFVSFWDWEEKEGIIYWTTKHSFAEISKLNRQQFPVNQPDQKILRETTEIFEQFPGVKDFLKQMGFSIEIKGEKIVYSTPTKEHFQQKWEEHLKQNPQFPELSIQEVGEILSPDDFFRLFLENDLIFSKPPELIHDSFYHIEILVFNIYQDPTNYRRYKQDLKTLFLNLDAHIDRIKTDPEKWVKVLNSRMRGPKLTVERLSQLQEILKWSLRATLDNSTTGYLRSFYSKEEIIGYIYNQNLDVLDLEAWCKTAAKEMGKSFEEIARLLIGSSKTPAIKEILEAFYRTADPF
jgi:hypothetical protein